MEKPLELGSYNVLPAWNKFDLLWLKYFSFVFLGLVIISVPDDIHSPESPWLLATDMQDMCNLDIYLTCECWDEGESNQHQDWDI